MTIKDVVSMPLDSQPVNIYFPDKQGKSIYQNLFYLLYLSPCFYIHKKWALLDSIFRKAKIDACAKLLLWINQRFQHILTDISDDSAKFLEIDKLILYLDNLNYQEIVLENKLDKSSYF